jgi:putative endonuclease
LIARCGVDEGLRRRVVGCEFPMRVVTPDVFRGPPAGMVLGMRDRQPCVYVPASGFDGTIHTGVTSTLIGRTMQHRGGAFEGVTRRYRVVMPVRDGKANVIERDHPDRADLAVGLGLPPLK